MMTFRQCVKFLLSPPFSLLSLSARIPHPFFVPRKIAHRSDYTLLPRLYSISLFRFSPSNQPPLVANPHAAYPTLQPQSHNHPCAPQIFAQIQHLLHSNRHIYMVLSPLLFLAIPHPIRSLLLLSPLLYPHTILAILHEQLQLCHACCH